MVDSETRRLLNARITQTNHSDGRRTGKVAVLYPAIYTFRHVLAQENQDKIKLLQLSTRYKLFSVRLSTVQSALWLVDTGRVRHRLRAYENRLQVDHRQLHTERRLDTERRQRLAIIRQNYNCCQT